MKNKFQIIFSSISINESFARNVIASFIMFKNPTVAVISDVKTAVSEAVTNAIVHGYPDTEGDVTLSAEIDGDILKVTVKDLGVGINDVEKVQEPFYTTKLSDERSGMGFTVMKSFMDSVEVFSTVNVGTTVVMTKILTDKGES